MLTGNADRTIDWLLANGNLLEALLWIGIAAGFLVGMAGPAHRGTKALAAIAFLAFGLSDLVEMRTGAWWEPWWLLLWKVSCVLALVGLLAHYVKLRRQTG